MPLIADAVSRLSYDFIVCGAGSAGCVVARRLAENGDANVLLLDAGSDDDVAEVMDPALWVKNIGSERDWGFVAEPNVALEGRSLPLSMGKVLGGGSSTNGLMWIRGHREDWDGYAVESGDSSWSYDAVKSIYDRIEDRNEMPASGESSGLVHLETANPSGATPLLVEAAASLGLATFDRPNGRMMELAAAAATMEVIVRNGRRRSMYRSYAVPVLGQRNLHVMTDATVTRLRIENGRVHGIEFRRHGRAFEARADKEVIASLGAINTPKLLFQSGIGDQDELKRFGIKVRQHSPGVGSNFQDHIMLFGVAWEMRDREVAPNAARAVVQYASVTDLDLPNIQILQSAGGTIQAEMKSRGLPPTAWWSLAPGLVRPQSRGSLRFTGPAPDDKVRIEGNHLADASDKKAMVAAIELCRELGNTAALRPCVKRELLPGATSPSDLHRFVRERTVTYWHQSCTAKMGQDEMSVVDGTLKVYGIDNLRIADASILPRIPTANTMAPCVIIGERAGAMIRKEHAM